MLKVFKCKALRVCLVLQCLQIASGQLAQNICSEGKFKCNNGQCIEGDLQCNTFKECDDGSDETFAACYQWKCPGHRCSYGACFEKSKFCDGTDDCGDGTDEQEFDCSKNRTNYAAIISGKCNNEYNLHFECKKGKECVLYSQVCDGTEQCPDGSDEATKLCVGTYCPDWAFRCAYGACIDRKKVCDGVMDCRDETDEMFPVCKDGHNFTQRTTPRTPIYIPPIIHHIPTTSKPNQTVELKSCSVPKSYEHLQLRTIDNGLQNLMGNTVSHQTTVRLRCDRNHALQGFDVNTCIDGAWQQTLAECVKVCDEKTITNDFKISAVCSYNRNVIDCKRDNLFVNTVALIKCQTGYVSVNSNQRGERICGLDGKWKKFRASSRRLTCKPDCGRTFKTVQGFPWMVSIFRRQPENNFKFSCLGAIVDPIFVLTAASCFPSSEVNPADFIVVLGNHSVEFNLYKEHGYDTKNIAEVNVIDLKPLALLRVVKPFVLSAKVRPVCLRNVTESVNTNLEGSFGEPLVNADNGTYYLTHIADQNKELIALNDKISKIASVIKQNLVKHKI